MARFDGKVVLVSGGARGQGAAEARQLVKEGAKVVIGDVLEKEGTALAKELGRAAVFLRQDVTSEADWDRVMAEIDGAHGRLDVLVNNAGIAVLRPIEDMTLAEWNLQNDVNLASVFLGTKRAVAAMRKAGNGGSIINLSSVAGLFGVPACGAYAASKGGVRLFSKVIAVECAKDRIRCNSVHPGMILTNMQGVAAEDNAANYDATLALIPMGYMGDPIEIANMNLFLASDESRYVTGTEMIVDGGMAAT